jgi:hypothetical protein
MQRLLPHASLVLSTAEPPPNSSDADADDDNAIVTHTVWVSGSQAKHPVLKAIT